MPHHDSVQSAIRRTNAGDQIVKRGSVGAYDVHDHIGRQLPQEIKVGRAHYVAGFGDIVDDDLADGPIAVAERRGG